MTTNTVGPRTGAEFEAWVGPYLGVLNRLAASYVPAADRDDLVQETLTRAWTKRASYDPERGSPQTWLLALLFDQARRAWRTRRGPLLGEPAELSEPGPSAGSLDLRRAVNALPRRQRQVVVLFYYLDLPINEIAAILGCAPGTAKSTLHDARTRLSTELRDHEH